MKKVQWFGIGAAMLAVLAALLLLTAQAGQGSEEVFAALSLSEQDTSRANALRGDVVAALEQEGMTLAVRSADGRLSQQVEDIQALMALHPQYLLVVPVKTLGLETVLNAARQAGIQVIILDRNLRNAPFTDYLTQISTDAYEEGLLCARLLGDYFDGKPGSVLELQGRAGSSLTTDRSRGFRDGLCEYDNMHIAQVLQGDFDRTTADHLVTEYLYRGGSFNAVFGHSDEEGLGALSALDIPQNHPDIPIVSVNGQQEIKIALLSESYLATIYSSPCIGARVVEVIRAAEAGEPVEKWIPINIAVYTQENASQMPEY